MIRTNCSIALVLLFSFALVFTSACSTRKGEEQKSEAKKQETSSTSSTTSEQDNTNKKQKQSSEEKIQLESTNTKKEDSGNKAESNGEKQNISNKHPTEMPDSWKNGPDRKIKIGTKPGMKYDVTSITVQPGEKIKLVFENTSNLQHNLVLVRPGTVDKVGQKGMKVGPGKEFVPEMDAVMYHTSLLSPGEKEVIYFKAPTTPDEYTYVCTYPGHYQVMQGTMTVKKKTKK